MFHYVYMVKCKDTGEFYYGSRSSSRKPEEDSYMGSMCTWKPNKKNLIKTIIKSDFIDRSDAYYFEREIILMHSNDPLNRNYSIPSKNGGGALPGSKNSFYGKKHTNFALQKMKDHSNNAGSNNPMFGKTHTDSSKKKMSERKIGVYDGPNNPRAKRLYQYDLSGNLINLWECATDCVNHYNYSGIKLSRGNISSFAKNNSDLNNNLKRLNSFVFAFIEIDSSRFSKFKKNNEVQNNDRS